MSATLLRMSLVLVGYRGSGKSTLGRLLAGRLGCGLVDTDELVVRTAGRSIKAIFEQEGEGHFRDLEAQALAEALGGPQAVIATGGGVVMRPENRRAIGASGLPVLYLRGEPELLLSRIRGDVATAVNRPNLTALGGGLEEVRQLLTLRDPLYREVATAVLELAGRSPEELADLAMEMLGREPQPTTKNK